MVETTYNIFIKDIKLLSLSGGIALLEAPSDFQKNMVEERYLTLLGSGFEEVLGFKVDVEVTSHSQPEETEAPAQLSTSREDSYTFDNFIVGPYNNYAHAMAKAVSENPASQYNPLFIYGESGLGKTHLLMAIKNGIKKNFPAYKIIYVDAEDFTNELISAIRTETTAQLRERYRTADVLLIDDVQFIGGKESTEEELFHTINTLLKANKQLVLTSDRPPKDIKSLEARLRSRFEGGITADIKAPDYETRVAIIMSKAEEIDFKIPNDVVDYLALNIKSNIRQLEGAVKKISAQCTYSDIKTPTIKLAQAAIKDIMNDHLPPPVKIERIINEVSRTFEVSVEDIRSIKQDAEISRARQVAMYVIRRVVDGMTMEKIGEEFSNRNYATVVYAIKKISQTMRTDTLLRTTVEDIEKNCQSV